MTIKTRTFITLTKFKNEEYFIISSLGAHLSNRSDAAILRESASI